MRSILDLPAQLYDLGCIQFGSFTLKSGVADLANRGHKLHTLMTLRSVLLELLKSRRISGEQHKEVTDYLNGFSTNVHATSS